MAASIRRIGKDTEVDRMLNELFVSPIRTGYVEVGKEKYVLPIYYAEHAEELRNFQVRDDDVYVAGHVKTGTTWIFEMVWLLVKNLNYEEALTNTEKQTPEIEAYIMLDAKKMETDLNIDLSSWRYREWQPSPRCLKTHLGWSLLPQEIQNGSKKPKIIVILRNPHDTCVSYYHYSKVADGYTGNFEDFCKLFMKGRVCFGPFWEQVLSYWQERNRSNLFFVHYSEMKKDLPLVIRKVANFLNKTLTESDIAKMTDYLSFENMRKNPSTNEEDVVETIYKFYNLTTAEGNKMRCGKEGGYKSEMTSELIEKFDIWTKTKIAETGITF